MGAVSTLSSTTYSYKVSIEDAPHSAVTDQLLLLTKPSQSTWPGSPLRASGAFVRPFVIQHLDGIQDHQVGQAQPDDEFERQKRRILNKLACAPGRR